MKTIENFDFCELGFTGTQRTNGKDMKRDLIFAQDPWLTHAIFSASLLLINGVAKQLYPISFSDMEIE